MSTAPCSWAVAPSTCDGDWDNYPQPVQDFATSLATKVMWSATGRRYGLCSNVVRPCGKYENNGWLGGTLYGNWSWGLGWGWYGFGGFYGGCGCGINGNGWCDCVPANQIWLPGPVNTVSQVLQDGAIVDPAAYRVDDGWWLVRTDGNSWPWRQNYSVDVPATNTLEVTYLRGLAIPSDVLYGAGLLASQYAKACVGAACQLPSRVTSVVRQGVTVSALDPTLMLSAGLTGNFLVDQVILADNPNRIKGRRRVVSSDLPVNRVVTQA